MGTRARFLCLEWTRCVDKGNVFPAHVQIGACTVVIQSGTETQKNRTAGYNNRGNAYFGKKDYDRDIADYDRAIALNSGMRAFPPRLLRARRCARPGRLWRARKELNPLLTRFWRS